MIDYGQLGHAEVVNVSVPADKYSEIAANYVALLNKNGDRPDFMDRGPEYRSLVGLPGGVNSPLFKELEKAGKDKVEFRAGNGDDGDTLGKRLVWVMDSDTFPFYPAEPYHQFHDGFSPHVRM